MKRYTRQQKEAVAILSIGTFLEYFDLMLYVHMAVLLNELFFPQTDPLTAKLFAAFTFCSTFILRPVGGLIIGWIGDQIGRKSTIILTTTIMAASCLTMASIGTYAEIGVTASIVMIICRVSQGISSLGEIVGAQLYLIETLKRPHKYIGSGMISIGANLGGLFALLVASFAISVHFNWRIAFWMGAVIAIVGLFARVRLREVPEFVDFRRRMKIKMELNARNPDLIEENVSYGEKLDKKAILSYFLMHFAWPVCFYSTFMYMGEFMKDSLELTAEQVINQNLKVTILLTVGLGVTVYFIKKYHPIKITKNYIKLFIVFLPFAPYCLSHIKGLLLVSCVQFMLYLPVLCSFGMETVCFKYMPIARRFTILASMFGLSAALAFAVVSFSLIPLTKYLGYYALWVIFVPVIAGLLYALEYVKQLEKEKGRYDNYPKEDDPEYPDTALVEGDYEYDLQNNPAYQAYHADCQYAHSLLGVVAYRMQLSNRKVNIKLIKKAIIFAKKWHDGQFRETGEPFYSHPLAVASIVTDYHLKTDVIVGAILHDVVEDTECPLALIVEEFNPRIAQIVDRLTRVRLDENGVRTKWPLQETMERLHRDHDYEALLIKQIDRLHNLETIGHKSREKQEKIAIETHHHLMTAVGYVADKLNIGNVLSLENKLFKCCRDILFKAH